MCRLSYAGGSGHFFQAIFKNDAIAVNAIGYALTEDETLLIRAFIFSGLQSFFNRFNTVDLVAPDWKHLFSLLIVYEMSVYAAFYNIIAVTDKLFTGYSIFRISIRSHGLCQYFLRNLCIDFLRTSIPYINYVRTVRSFCAKFLRRSSTNVRTYILRSYSKAV